MSTTHPAMLDDDGSGTVGTIVNNAYVTAYDAAIDAAIAAASPLACGRLTLTTGTPVTTADVTAATTLFYTPTQGCNRITLWNGSALVSDTLSEVSLAVPATTSQLYDVFAVDTAGTVSIEALAWTNDTTRATALTVQNGFLAKSGAPTRRYVGSFRTTTVSGQTEDSATKRYVWNYYNRVRRRLTVTESTATWVGSGTVFRQVRGSVTNQVDVVVGVADVTVSLRAGLMANNGTTNNTSFATAIGVDSTTTPAAGSIIVSNFLAPASASVFVPLTTTLEHNATVGRHLYIWLERQGDATPANTLYFGDHTAASGGQSGLTGSIDG